VAELAVILVNYGSPADTIACCRSLRRSTLRDVSIFIVDNASTSESAQLLASACDGATLLPCPVNTGFAEGNNIGLREALPRGARFFLLLNNDTEVADNALEELLLFARAHPLAGVIGGKILYHHTPSVIWSAGGYFSEHSAVGGHYGIGRRDGPAFSVPRQCDFVSGCCMLLRRELVESVGMLDASYFAYVEDADLCVRARRAGFEVWYAPSAVITHKISRTSSWDSPVYIYFNLRNKLLFLHRHASLMGTLPWVPRLLLFYIRQFLRLALKKRHRLSLRAAWYGVVDGLRNRSGHLGQGRMSLLNSQR